MRRDFAENPPGGRKIHARPDSRMAEAILLQVQRRDLEILGYLSGDLAVFSP